VSDGGTSERAALARLEDLLARREERPLTEAEERELCACLGTPEGRRRLVAHQLLTTELGARLSGPDLSDDLHPRARVPRPVLAGAAVGALAAGALVLFLVKDRTPTRPPAAPKATMSSARGVVTAPPPPPPRFRLEPTPSSPVRALAPDEARLARPGGFYAELAAASTQAVTRQRAWKPDGSGLYLENREAWRCSASQRYGLDTLIAAAVLGRADWLAEAWPSVEATFAHQRPDGGFGDAPVCAAVYLGQLAVALDTLAQSPLGKETAARVTALHPALRRAADWLARPKVLAALREEKPSTPTPDFAGAAALASFAVRLEDPTLLAAAVELADSGLSTQRADGAFIHQGGPDSAYQTFRTLQLHWLLSTLPLPRYEAAARAAGDWLRTRILPDGSLDLTGNSYNKPCDPAAPACKPPHFRSPDLRLVLLVHAARFDPSARPLADRVYEAEVAAARRNRR
jgi:hypothetical protein